VIEAHSEADDIGEENGDHFEYLRLGPSAVLRGGYKREPSGVRI
jgi:hypothetical protein